MTSAPQRGVPGTPSRRRARRSRSRRSRPGNVLAHRSAIRPAESSAPLISTSYGGGAWRAEFTAILHDAMREWLDLCCGTGDLAFAFRKQAPHGAESSARISFRRCSSGRARRLQGRCHCRIYRGGCITPPIRSASFDLVSCGLRFPQSCELRTWIAGNPASVEARRKLWVSWNCGALGKAFVRCIAFTFRAHLPSGGMISGCLGVYVSPNSVSKFPFSEELKLQFDRAGFCDVQFERWTEAS